MLYAPVLSVNVVKHVCWGTSDFFFLTGRMERSVLRSISTFGTKTVSYASASP